MKSRIEDMNIIKKKLLKMECNLIDEKVFVELFLRTRQRPTFPHLKDAVLSAMRGLASGFGMEPGVSLSL